MQDLKTRMLISGMSWEAQETVALKNIYVQIQSFYQHTELNLDDLGKEEILGELKALSNKIEDLIGYTYNEMNRLIESDKTYYCNTCMEDMSGQHSHNS